MLQLRLHIRPFHRHSNAAPKYQRKHEVVEGPVSDHIEAPLS